MKKTILLFLVWVMILTFAGCSKEVTLNLSYGERTGKYTGEMANGVPNGQGTFTTINPNGAKWTYEGEFKDGHFEGEGKTTWEGGQIEIGTYKNDEIVPMSADDIKAMYTSPQDFKGRCVEVIGKVFSSPEYSSEGVGFQMWGDVENSENNTIVYVHDPSFKVKSDDYVKITGIVGDPFDGKNAFGATLTAPTIQAKKYAVLNYQEAVSPTLKTINVNQTKTQFGYSVTVQKIEFAEKETRVYIKVVNKGSAKFNLYSFSSKITQNGKQFEQQSNYNADYPEIQTDLLVGSTTEGIIAYPKLEQGAFKIILECYSDNYREDLQDFIFDIK